MIFNSWYRDVLLSRMRISLFLPASARKIRPKFDFVKIHLKHFISGLLMRSWIIERNDHPIQ